MQSIGKEAILVLACLGFLPAEPRDKVGGAITDKASCQLTNSQIIDRSAHIVTWSSD
ncbi:hypothetical protein DPMN_127056 [Dreissena polymorpha]|uniref:Uncharacterized protein n=1 Tax=Dreissena polymorpha TaxID=45954 RepID=A0A9D4JYS2_DREPO|nr:hypothetical protein DPMN_127056 [Dreissena polymorpha]